MKVYVSARIKRKESVLAAKIIVRKNPVQMRQNVQKTTKQTVIFASVPIPMLIQEKIVTKVNLIGF